MSKSCKNKVNIEYTAVLKGTLLCLFVDICHSINLHSYTDVHPGKCTFKVEFLT